MSMDLDELITDFRSGTLEHLSEIEEALLAIEKKSEVCTNMALIKRVIHTIKGASGSLGLTFGSSVCHSFEDLLNQIDIDNISKEELDRSIGFHDLLLDYFDKSPKVDQNVLNEYMQTLAALNLTVKNSIGKRFLIVEPSSTLAQLVSLLLQKCGVSTATVTDGYIALGRLINEDFDEVVTANKVPSISGLELVTMLSNLEKFKETPITLMTSAEHDFKDLKQVKIVKKGPNLLNSLIENWPEISSKESEGDGHTEAREESISIAYDEKPIKILYIDDDVFIVKLVDVMFSQMKGVDFIGINSAKEALKSLKEINPDLILLDVIMPEMLGTDVFKEIRKDESIIAPIIFLTGQDLESEITKLISLGAIGVISKPFKPKTFYKEINKILVEAKSDLLLKK